MTRYKADKCYNYVDKQVEYIRPVGSSVESKYQELDFVNSSRKRWLDAKQEEFESTINELTSALSNSSYTPT